MQGADPHDPACVGRPAEPALPVIGQGASGLRIAVAGGYFAGSGVAAAAVATAAHALAATRVVEVPEAARARAAAFVITASEGADLHLADLKSRAADFDPMTRDRLLAGALIPAGWVLRAQRFRRWYREQVLALFRDADILLAPATPCVAPKIGQETIEIDGVTMPPRPFIGVYTQPLSFIGLPIVAAPLRRPGELPIGVQIIAAPWREADALRVAWQLERDGITNAEPVLG
jgi:Asp-tRNA(Asn)/Glu-tRNA(Gln) amidotransferase A subunit family amidase